MSNGTHHDDVIIIKKAAVTLIVLAAIVGGVVGYLLCHFITKEEAAERGIETGNQAAIHQPYQTPDSTV